MTDKAIDRPRIRASRRLGSAGGLVYPILSLGLGLIAWHIAGTAEPVLLSTPSRSWDALVALAASGQLGEALLESGRIFGIGLVVSIVVGVLYGILLARVRVVYDATAWLVFALQALPVVALAPIVVVVLGFGIGAQVFVVVFGAVFPILINTTEGARHLPRGLVDVTHIYRSREWRIWIDLLLPHTVPYAMTGIRQGIALAFVGTLVAEFFIQATGIGGLILGAAARFDTATVLALTVLVAIIATTLMGLGRLLERLVAGWREDVNS